MATSKTIKSQLGFVKVMQKLIEALKDIDAAHFQTLFSRKEKKFEEFDDIIKDYIKLVHGIGDIIGSHHPLLKAESKRVAAIVLSSDAGFMGKLNTNLCREAMNLVEDFEEAELIVLGKKGLVRLRYAEAKVISFPAIVEEKRYEQIRELKDFVVKQRLNSEIGDLYLISPRSISFGKQDVEKIRLLPAVDLFKERLTIQIEKWQEVCVESKFSDIIEYLVETWLLQKLYDAAFESKLAEFSARTMHLESSLDYLKEELKRLSLAYNKARQGEIDSGMRETFASLMGSSV